MECEVRGKRTSAAHVWEAPFVVLKSAYAMTKTMS